MDLLYLALVVFVIVVSVIVFKYYKSTYYKITKKSILTAYYDLGSYGEYLIYKNLTFAEKQGAKFLFNVYLYKNETETTEIDVLLITKGGIIVFESKNYSGWIFGSEFSKTWTQSLPAGKGRKAIKEHFLNPIFQNKLHISALKNVIGEDYPIISVVALSDRCTIKNITTTEQNSYLLHRKDIVGPTKKIMKDDIISSEKIDEIYNTLYPFTQVSEEVKQKHIDDIKKDHNNESENI